MRSSYRINLVLFIIFLFCYACVLLTGINKELFIYVNSLSRYTGNVLWSDLTFLGDTLPAIVVILLFIRKMPEAVWSGILATIIATLLVNILKYCFSLPRPPAVLDIGTFNIIGTAIYARSFPSGHTVTIFTLAGIIIFYFRSLFLRIAIVFLAFLVGISRIVVGVHWPSDVLAGAAIGILCAVTGVYIVTKLEWRENKWLQLIIGFFLIFSDLYLLFIYDCRYEQAIYLQTFFALAVLLAGIREYYLLLKSSD